MNDPVHTLLPALGTVLLMVALVLAEPDMGTACMIVLIAAAMLFVSGLSTAIHRRRRSRGHSGHLPVDCARAVSAGARSGLLVAGRRPARARISIVAIADRGGLGRIHGRGLDGEPPEAFFPAGSAYRLYLRGDLRGARIHRRGRSCWRFSPCMAGADLSPR